MLTIAICDDEKEQIVLTQSAVKRFFAETETDDYQIKSFTSPFSFLDHYDNGNHPDIAFLDVCMPWMQGTAVAREIRSQHDATQIVFLTISDEYAVEAFALHAAHYLTKPFTQDQFDDAMRQALRNLPQKEPPSIACQSKGGSVHLVQIDEITYIESRSHTQCIHTGSGIVFEEQQTLGGVFEKLEGIAPGQFIIPYRGVIVNQKAIRQIETEHLILKDSTRIPIARRGYRKLRAAYFDFFFATDERP